MSTPPATVRLNATTAPAAARNSHRLRPGRQLRQMIDAQQEALSAALTLPPEDKMKAAHMRAYHDITRLIMDYSGHGKPKPVDAKNDTTKHKPRKPIEPQELP